MRKVILTVTIAAMPAFASLEASAATATTGDFPFAISSNSVLDDAGVKPEKRSLLSKVMDTVSFKRNDVTLSNVSADTEKKAETCTEAEKQKLAEAAGEDTEEEKAITGPEPMYFAF
ncbi:hypothetical protein PUV54_12505 [Hyphococcus flavus]|uniref:Uncharacterized protein n=1 Tax=Hyphococcus flavus TaxID=1866326 RepID=A0AAE9ZAK4_9PROT|nr:hypothetical protein [Hyphococcus flavus]WDI30774.1 hypothetical protein PUV54_12505 [Hyphococcus flavus]